MIYSIYIDKEKALKFALKVRDIPRTIPVNQDTSEISPSEPSFFFFGGACRREFADDYLPCDWLSALVFTE